MTGFDNPKDDGSVGTKVLYTCSYLFVSLLFLYSLNSSIVNRVFENDLWWMIPSLYHYTEDKSFGEIIKFIFGIEPYMLGSPIVKSFLYFVLKSSGPEAKNFIYILLVVHFVNSILLFFLCRRLKFNLRISFLSALIYLALYAHFESYLWPFNMQHLSVTFFILLLLNLYLKTDELINKCEKYRRYWILTVLANLAASFSRMSIFILPAIIISHILLSSRNNIERIKKYDLWLPFFITYLIYPLILLTSVGDDQAELFLTIKGISPTLNWLIFFIGGILFLFILRFGIKNLHYWGYRFKWSIFLIIFLGIWAIAIIKDIRNLILLYNIIVPFSGTINSFLNPLQSVLLIDSAQGNYQIHSQMSLFGFFIGVISIYVFSIKFLFENRQLLIFLVWYAIAFMYLNLYSNILSRYIVYISPFICLVISSVIALLYDYIMKRVNLKIWWKEMILTTIFVLLLIPNIIAIKLELFRNKMACSFYLYDYIRTANIIKKDIIDKKYGKVYISNARPMPFKELWPFSPVDPRIFYNLRFVLSQVLNNDKLDNFVINNGDSKDVKDNLHYVIQDDKIINSSGENIDKFRNSLDKGVRELNNKDYKSAISSFEKAVNIRPFFINYILLNYQLEDSVWITDGKDIDSWINRIDTQSKRNEKALYIRSIIKDEISSYIQALFYLSYLYDRLGDSEKSKYWFSKITYLDSKPEKVFFMLSQIPEIRSDEKAILFLKNVTDSVSFPSLWHIPVRDRLPTDFQIFVVRFVFDGKINRIIDTNVIPYMKAHRRERAKLHSMPQEL